MRQRGQVVEAKHQNDVHREQLDAFHPVRLAIVRDEGDAEERETDGDELEDREQQSIGCGATA